MGCDGYLGEANGNLEHQIVQAFINTISWVHSTTEPQVMALGAVDLYSGWSKYCWSDHKRIIPAVEEDDVASQKHKSTGKINARCMLLHSIDALGSALCNTLYTASISTHTLDLLDC